MPIKQGLTVFFFERVGLPISIFCLVLKNCVKKPFFSFIKTVVRYTGLETVLENIDDGQEILVGTCQLGTGEFPAKIEGEPLECQRIYTRPEMFSMPVKLFPISKHI